MQMNWSDLVEKVKLAIYRSDSIPHNAEHDPDRLVALIEQLLLSFTPQRSGNQLLQTNQMLQVVLGQVQQHVWNAGSTPHQPDHDPDGLVQEISDIFNEYSRSYDLGNVAPTGMAPYVADKNPSTSKPIKSNIAFPLSGINPVDEAPGTTFTTSFDPYGDPAELAYKEELSHQKDIAKIQLPSQHPHNIAPDSPSTGA